MNIQEIEFLIQTWASKKPKIKSVWLFGSRVRGNHRPDSDLDIAVEFLEEVLLDSPRSIGYIELYSPELNEFMDCKDEWETELKEFLPHEIDLECFRGDETPIIKEALSKSSKLIYKNETNNKTKF